MRGGNGTGRKGKEGEGRERGGIGRGLVRASIRSAYFHFIPGQITFAYTAPPTRLQANGENMTHNHNLAQARAEAIAVNVNK